MKPPTNVVAAFPAGRSRASVTPMRKPKPKTKTPGRRARGKKVLSDETESQGGPLLRLMQEGRCGNRIAFRSVTRRVKSRDPLDEYHPQQTRRILERARHARLDAPLYGLWRLIMDLMWDQDGPIHNDPQWLGAHVKMSTRATKAALAELAERGMITLSDRFIADAFTNDAIIANRAFLGERAASGAKGGAASARNRALTASSGASFRETREKTRETLPTPAPDLREKVREAAKNKGRAQAELAAEPSAQPAAIENRESYSEKESTGPGGEGAGESAAAIDSVAPPQSLPFGPWDALRREVKERVWGPNGGKGPASDLRQSLDTRLHPPLRKNG